MANPPPIDDFRHTLTVEVSYTLRYVQDEPPLADGWYVDIREQMNTPMAYGDSRLTRHGPIPFELIERFVAEHVALTRAEITNVLKLLGERNGDG